MSRLTESEENTFQFTMNYTFKRKGSTTQKTLFQLKENGKPSTSDQLFERSLAFKDFDNDDLANKLIYPEAWKDLKPMLNITGTSVEFDYTVL